MKYPKHLAIVAALGAVLALLPQAAFAANVVKIVKDGEPPEYEETKYSAKLVEYNYRGVVAGGGFVAPGAGSIKEIYLGELRLTLKEPRFKTGGVETDELGHVKILFSASLVKEGFIVLLTPEQLKTLEGLLAKAKRN